ncbi:hypothetical protein PV325_007870 [Microctonus aethiopoides]|nr:hypothetical protein PV325_007870 [Microctonus aethiopoides]
MRLEFHVLLALTFALKREATGNLDDTALQLYKDGDYGAYLDLEASISEQQEEFESFQTKRQAKLCTTRVFLVAHRKEEARTKAIWYQTREREKQNREPFP